MIIFYYCLFLLFIPIVYSSLSLLFLPSNKQTNQQKIIIKKTQFLKKIDEKFTLPMGCKFSSSDLVYDRAPCRVVDYLCLLALVVDFPETEVWCCLLLLLLLFVFCFLFCFYFFFYFFFFIFFYFYFFYFYFIFWEI